MELVGVRGFEPPTPCSQSRCATRLRHTPPDPRADAPEPKVYHPVRKRRAARTARPRWSTRAFSSGASSAKVRRSGGEGNGGAQLVNQRILRPSLGVPIDHTLSCELPPGGSP